MADEPAGVVAPRLDGAERGAAKQRRGPERADEQSGLPSGSGDDRAAHDGASGDHRPVRLAREGADDAVALRVRVREREVGDRRVGADASEEAGAGAADLHGQVRDRVAVAVERAGERRGLFPEEGLPGRAGEIDVGAEGVGADAVRGDPLQVGARPDDDGGAGLRAERGGRQGEQGKEENACVFHGVSRVPRILHDSRA